MVRHPLSPELKTKVLLDVTHWEPMGAQTMEMFTKALPFPVSFC